MAMPSPAYLCSQEHFHWWVHQSGLLYVLVWEMQTQKLFDVIVGAIASYELVADLIGKLYRSQDRLSRGANGQSHYRPSRWGPAEHYRTLWLCEWPVKDSRLPISCLCHKGLNFICDIAKTSWFQREIPVVRHPVTSPCAASLLG